ncbi:MAG TPA: aminoacyl-tRNA hydrolase [Dehalococcoidia bacterium]|nr:aminoacyl-tRNA hydrolase [Dehalococcoidia bacterium]
MSFRRSRPDDPLSRGAVDRVRALLGQVRSARGRTPEPPRRPHWIIAGLGNPGPRYRQTRHNLGFLCVDRLAERHGLRFDQVRHGADLAAGPIADRVVWLIKPRTYMNLSGQAIGPALRAAGVGPDRLLVVYDDLDLALGTIRLRQSGSAGGHNGMKSIIQSLATSEFPRLRAGVGRPRPGRDPVEYVLEEFGPDEWPVVEQVRDRAAEAIQVALTDGLNAAMNQFNRRE